MGRAVCLSNLLKDVLADGAGFCSSVLVKCHHTRLLVPSRPTPTLPRQDWLKFTGFDLTLTLHLHPTLQRANHGLSPALLVPEEVMAV